MKKLLVAIAVLLTVPAYAQNAGFYVPGHEYSIRDTENGVLVTGPVNLSFCIDLLNDNNQSKDAGLGSLCSSAIDYVNFATLCKNSLDADAADYNTCKTNSDTNYGYYTQCFSDAKANETNRQQWISYSKGQTTLVNKLRKACGSKCRKIK